jgi:hypothetical protein
MRPPVGRQRAFTAVVVAAAMAPIGCTERVALLSAQTGDAAAGFDAAPEDVGSPHPPPLDSGPEPRCSDFNQNVRLEFETPEVVIALDRSYSMFQHKPGARSWWQVAKQELSTYIEANEGAIMFGYEEFPGRAQCDPGVGCCGSSVLVSPYLNSHWDIEKQWHCDGPASFCYETTVESPSGDALGRIRSFFDQETDPVPDRFVLLVTDGDPSCGSNPDECDRAQRQANKLFSMGGIKTMVLAIGDDARSSMCLDMVAMMGQTGGAGSPSFIWAGDQNHLQDQLQKAMAPAEERACRFLMRAEVKNREKLSVAANFMPVPRDPTHREGWDFDPPDAPELQIYGSVCTKLKSNEIEHRAVRAQLSCTQCGSSIDCQ